VRLLNPRRKPATTPIYVKQPFWTASRKIWLQCLVIVLLGTSFGLIGVACAQPSCAPLPSGIVSWWRAENNSLDQIGGNNGTNVGSVTYVAGETSQAFQLGGNSSAVKLGNPLSLRVQNFTLEGWISRSSDSVVDTNGGGFAYLFGYGMGGYGFGITDSGTLLLTNVGIVGASNGVAITVAVTDTAFHHVAVTKSGTTVVFYLDGVAWSADPLGTSFPFTNSAAIGARGDDLTASFFGSIDELAVYNRALAYEEIQAIYAAGSLGKCSGTTAPSISVQPVDQTSAVQGGARFAVVAGGSAPLRYQWTFNGTNLPGTTNSTLTIANLQFSEAGPYFVIVTNSFGAVTSSVASLTVNPRLSCVTAPTGIVSWWRGEFDAVDAAGTNHGTLVQDTDYGPAEVGAGFVTDGFKDGVNVGTAASLRMQNFTVECWIRRASSTVVNLGGGPDTAALFFSFGAGGYGFGFESGGRPLLSKIGIDGVVVDPPVSDTAWHHMAVTKSGTSVTFYVDGVAYPTSYVTTFTFTTNAGVGFRPDTGANSFYGTVDDLAVYNRPLGADEISGIYNAGPGGKCVPSLAPVITADPQSVTNIAGTNVAFTVAATGYPTLSYQWQFRGTNLAGATGYFLSVTNIQLANVGPYRVIVTNGYGAVTSAIANLVIQSPPIINTQPQSVTNYPGATVNFAVLLSGTPPFYFQWQHAATNIPGANEYSLVLSNIQIADTGTYLVVITNIFGAVTSAPATLSLFTAPLITNQPLSQVVPIGANASFSVGAIGFSPFRYQWSHGTTNLPGATNSALFLNNIQLADGGSYSVSVSNNYGATVSSNALLTVTNPTCVPGPSGLVAWWQAEGSTDDSISGAASAIVGNTTYTNGKAGRAFAFSGNGAGVVVGRPVSLQLQDFTIETWAKRTATNAVNLGPGPTFDALFFSFGTNGYGFGMNSSGHLLLTKVSVDGLVSSAVIADTAFHHLAITKTGTTVTFYVDGAAYPASTYGSTFSFASSAAIGFRADTSANSFYGALDELSIYNRALTPSEIQALFYSQVQGKCPIPLAWSVQPTNQSVIVGSNATMVAAASGTRPAALQWYLNGSPVNGATNSVLAMTGVTFFQGGSYHLSATNGLGGIVSSNATLTVLPLPLISNGSFEAGINGWVLSDIPSPLLALAVRPSGYYSGFGFFTTAATDGGFCLTDGFDGNGPGRIRAALDVVLPPSPVLLTFDYRLAWDTQNYPGSTKPRTFAVVVEPYGGGAGLQTNVVFTAAAGSANYDTGPLSGAVDLSGFAGRAIRISFDQNIPESFTGPGFFQLDNVRLTYPPAPPLLIARAGSNAVISWPVTFTNFAVAATTSLVPPIAWTPLPTNQITRSATNASMIIPSSTPGYLFFRLRSY
jgi:hypothetical protein